MYESIQYLMAKSHPATLYAVMLTHDSRVIVKQIEYWSQIGKVAEENPDLPFAMIRDILIAKQEEAVEEYRFG